MKPIYTLLITSALLLLTSGGVLVVGADGNHTSEPLNTGLINYPSLSEASNQMLLWSHMIQQENGLLLSSEMTDFVSLYDNSLAAIAFTRLEDYKRAESILSFYQSRMETELLSEKGGFFQSRNGSGNEGERRWLGDNAWLLIAIRLYRERTGSVRFDDMAFELEHWIRSLQEEDGSLKGGYNADGTEIPKVTEGIITAFRAVPGYDHFHRGILQYLENNRWDVKRQILIAHNEEASYGNAMDLHSLGYLVLENFPETALYDADRYYTKQNHTLNGQLVEGYGFDEDKDVIWVEGTAQMALAFSQAGNRTRAASLEAEILKTVVSSEKNGNISALPYSANMGSSFGAEKLWDHADLTPSLSSNMWFILYELNFNPLKADKKVIPLSDQFWL